MSDYIYLILIVTLGLFVAKDASATECKKDPKKVAAVFAQDYYNSKFKYFCVNYKAGKACMEKSFNSFYKFLSSCLNQDEQMDVLAKSFVFDTSGSPVGINYMSLQINTASAQLKKEMKQWR